MRHEHPKPNPKLPPSYRRTLPAPPTPLPETTESGVPDEKQGLSLTLEDRMEEYLDWVEGWCRIQ